MTSHPVTAFVAGLNTALDAVAGTPLWSLTPDQVASVLVDLHRERARLAELELRLVTQAGLDGVGDEVGAVGAVDTKAWWANTTHQTRRDVNRRTALAAALEARTVLGDAMKSGTVAEDQASVIVQALETLPEGVDQEVLTLAEKELVRLAAFHDALELMRLGKRILDVVAPEIGEAQLAKTLEREEEEAAKSARFTMSDDGHGKSHGRFTLPTAQAAMLRKALLALAAPKHQAALGESGSHLRPSVERMGEAFKEYVERYPTDRLANAGGVSARVVVTMTLSDFTDTTTQRPVHLDTGDVITAGQARQMACEAGIVPVVLDGMSQPLDVGRAKRFHTPAQRLAIALRDTTCTAMGCDRPPGMCHVHHDEQWSRGGATNVESGRLLCPKHHRMAHQSNYMMKATKNGRVIFSRT